MKNTQKEMTRRELELNEIEKVNGGIYVPRRPDDDDDDGNSGGGATGGW